MAWGRLMKSPLTGGGHAHKAAHFFADVSSRVLKIAERRRRRALVSWSSTARRGGQPDGAAARPDR